MVFKVLEIENLHYSHTMRTIITAAALLVSGCATSIPGIQREPVQATYTSAKQPLEIARCFKAKMPGLDVYPGENEVSVSNKNQFGAILMNWTIRPVPEGSVIDLRKTNSMTPGQAQMEQCF